MGYNLRCSKSDNAGLDETALRNTFAPSERKTQKKAPWLQFPLLKGDFYVDSMFSKFKNSKGFTGGSVYTNGLGYDRFNPWQSKGQHAETIMRFIHDVGVPQTLINDNAKEEVKGRAKAICNKYQLKIKTTVPYSQWQNKAEASIREIKKNVRRTLRHTNTPLKLWSYCTKWCAAVQRLTASTSTPFKGVPPIYQPTHYLTGTSRF
jgi:hypothetical protein